MNEIAKLRKARKLTQVRLAELANTSQPQIRRLENDERTLTRAWAERLAPHLGTTAEHIMFPERKGGYAERIKKVKLRRPDLAAVAEEAIEGVLRSIEERDEEVTQ